MKVKELIDKLENMDPEATVLLWEDIDSSGGWKQVTFVGSDHQTTAPDTYVCIE